MSALTRLETMELLALTSTVRDVVKRHADDSDEASADLAHAFTVLRDRIRTLGPDLIDR